MASIDKMYGTWAQHVELHRWIHKHRPSAKREVFDLMFAPPEGAVGPIAAFSVSTDKWLARKCALPFVLARIREQYRGTKTAVLANRRLNEIQAKRG